MGEKKKNVNHKDMEGNTEFLSWILLVTRAIDLDKAVGVLHAQPVSSTLRGSDKELHFVT